MRGAPKVQSDLPMFALKVKSKPEADYLDEEIKSAL
jgi:hypothetical protein